MRTWRKRKETLGVFSYYAKRHKSAYISVNNNTNWKKFYVLSIFTRWDGLSQKTISRYCPFKLVSRYRWMRFDGGEYICFLAVYKQMLGKGWDAPRALLKLFHVSCFFLWKQVIGPWLSTIPWVEILHTPPSLPPVNLHFFAYSTYAAMFVFSLFCLPITFCNRFI